MRLFEFSCKSSHICRYLVMSVFLAALVVNGTGTLMAQPTTLTINAGQQLSIGGVSTLDRGQFFTHTSTLFPPSSTASNPLGINLRFEVYSEDGLNLTAGRVSTEFDQFITDGLPEDFNRPGFVDPLALLFELQGPYRDFVTTGTRYESIRDSVTRPIFVNSGRSSAAFIPAIFRTGEQSDLFPNRDFYADFLRTYLREVVFGPNSFYPVPTDRYHIELINEPDLHVPGAFGGPGAAATLLASGQELARYHRDIAQDVKSEFPSTSIGGPSLAITDFAGDNYLRWNGTVKPFIDIAGADLDFYAIHPYERYDVQANGTVLRAVMQSPGRINSQIDMMLNQQEQSHGNRLPISMTEYSSFNFGVNRSIDNAAFAGYPRDEQQWDQSRNIREQLLLYINRPDAILSAVPFIFAAHFRNDAPTLEVDDNVIYERVANGDFVETFIGNTMRIYAPVKGDYINVEGTGEDLQSAAFRDGDTVYLLLNNLLDSPQQLDLNLLLSGAGTVDSAEITRVYRNGFGINVFQQNQDITSTFSNLTMNPKEGAVITFGISGDNGFTQMLSDETYFGDQVAVALNDGFLGRSPQILIDADTSNAIAAKLRVGYSRSRVDAFLVTINGNDIPVAAAGKGIDDEEFGLIDDGLISREVDIPLEFLNDGQNQLRLTFTGGGFISSTALVVTSTPPDTILLGDVDLDGAVNFLDIPAFITLLIAGDYQAEADINIDDVVDFADIPLFIDILVGQ